MDAAASVIRGMHMHMVIVLEITMRHTNTNANIALHSTIEESNLQNCFICLLFCLPNVINFQNTGETFITECIAVYLVIHRSLSSKKIENTMTQLINNIYPTSISKAFIASQVSF